MPEKEKTEMNIEKESEKESKISKVWNKIKKPLLTGVMAAGLLLSPTKKAEGVGFYYARPPPYFAAHLIEKDKDINVRLGWVALKKGDKLGEVGRLNEGQQFLEMAVNYFKKAYEKNKTAENYYLYVYSLYHLARTEKTYEGTEEKELEVLKLIEERLKEQWNDMDFIDLKQIIYYNLAIMYYRAAVNFKDVDKEMYLEREAYEPSKKEFYKQKAKDYTIKWLEFNEWMKENWDEFESFAWRKGYEDAAKENEMTIKQYFRECNDSFKEGNTKREKELKRLLNKLEKH